MNTNIFDSRKYPISLVVVFFNKLLNKKLTNPNIHFNDSNSSLFRKRLSRIKSRLQEFYSKSNLLDKMIYRISMESVEFETVEDSH